MLQAYLLRLVTDFLKLSLGSLFREEQHQRLGLPRSLLGKSNMCLRALVCGGPTLGLGFLFGDPGEVPSPLRILPDEGLSLGEAVCLDATGGAEGHTESYVCLAARHLWRGRRLSGSSSSPECAGRALAVLAWSAMLHGTQVVRCDRSWRQDGRKLQSFWWLHELDCLLWLCLLLWGPIRQMSY